MKRYTFGVVWLTLGAFVWTLCLGAYAAYGFQWEGRVSYRDFNGDLNFSQLKELREQMGDNGDVTGWGQSLNEQIGLSEFGASATIDVIWSDGDASRIWAPEMKRGQLPSEGDELGCALSEKTALKLFGSLDIIGREVNIAGVSMIVRGVFTLPEGIQALGVDPGRALAFCPAALAEEVFMTALNFTIYAPDGKAPPEVAEDWMQSAGLHTAGEFDGHEDAGDLLNLMCGLPGDALALMAVIEACLLLLAANRSAVKKFRRQREDIYGTHGAQARTLLSWLAKAAACAAGAYAAVRIAAHGGRIPMSYLPTRWSDFSFWPRLIETLSHSAAQSRFETALRPDMLLGRLMSLVAIFGLAATLLFLMARRNLRNQERIGATHLIFAGAIIFAAPLLALWAGDSMGWRVRSVPAALMVLPAALLLLWTVPEKVAHEEFERGNARVK